MEKPGLLEVSIFPVNKQKQATRVKSGIFEQTAKFGQSPCLFYRSNIGIKIN